MANFLLSAIIKRDCDSQKLTHDGDTEGTQTSGDKQGFIVAISDTPNKRPKWMLKPFRAFPEKLDFAG